jgi:hypothetical protein
MTMTELEQAIVEFLRDPGVRFMLRHGWLIVGVGFWLVALLCVCLGLFSPWQIYDEVMFALIGSGALSIYVRGVRL